MFWFLYEIQSPRVCAVTDGFVPFQPSSLILNFLPASSSSERPLILINPGEITSGVKIPFKASSKLRVVLSVRFMELTAMNGSKKAEL